MTYGYIYKIQFPNGKHYIGLTTTSLKQRQTQHKKTAKKGDIRCLYNALRKYEMVDTFQLIEIDTANTVEELCEKEIGYIIEYNSYYMNGNGYNMTHGGEGTFGYVFTEEDNQKNSEAHINYFLNNPDAGQKHGEALKNYYLTNPNARQKCSESQKKRFENPQEIQKNKEAVKNYYLNNPDARQKHKEAVKNYHLTNPDARQKISDGKGKNKPFDVFTKDGTFIKTFTYQFEAKEYLEKEYDISIFLSNISAVLSGKRNNTIGFVFKYK